MDGRLHVCQRCACQLVYPVEWREVRQFTWWVSLRCPECGASREGTFDQRQVSALDDALDSAQSEIQHTLGELTRANMTGEIDAFSAALAADAILPEDF